MKSNIICAFTTYQDDQLKKNDKDGRRVAARPRQ